MQKVIWGFKKTRYNFNQNSFEFHKLRDLKMYRCEKYLISSIINSFKWNDYREKDFLHQTPKVYLFEIFSYHWYLFLILLKTCCILICNVSYELVKETDLITLLYVIIYFSVIIHYYIMYIILLRCDDLIFWIRNVLAFIFQP